MPEQRLIEEVLVGIRDLREQQQQTAVKLAEMLSQMQQLNSMPANIQLNNNRLSDHESRISYIERLNLDKRLKKVEGTAFKIMALALMMVGVLSLLDRLANLSHMVRL